jgi:hypothetical protein
MRVLLVTSILATTLFSQSMIAEADPLRSATAPLARARIVHVQPRGEDFIPNSRANEAEQEKLSKFDAKQEKLDEALDKKLNICRC